MFDPGPCVYMEKIAGAPDIARPARPRPAARRDAAAGRQAPRLRRQRPDGDHARPRAPRRRDRADPRVRARASASSPTATCRPRCWRSRPGPASTCCGASAARPRACCRRPRSSRMGGQLIGRLWPRDDDERSRAIEAGYDLDEVLDVDRLVSGEDVFFAATGVTDGDLLQGVRYRDGAEATTESLVMRSRSGTVRKVAGDAQPGRSSASSPARGTGSAPTVAHALSRQASIGTTRISISTARRRARPRARRPDTRAPLRQHRREHVGALLLRRSHVPAVLAAPRACSAPRGRGRGAWGSRRRSSPSARRLGGSVTEHARKRGPHEQMEGHHRRHRVARQAEDERSGPVRRRTRSACPGRSATPQKTSSTPSSASAGLTWSCGADRDAAGRHHDVGCQRPRSASTVAS